MYKNGHSTLIDVDSTCSCKFIQLDSKRGFTFVEVMMTVVLLSLAIIPMASLMQKETRDTKMGRDRTFALHLASNIIERLKMEHIDALRINFSDPSLAQAALENLPELNRSCVHPSFMQMKEKFQSQAYLEFDSASNGRKAVLKVEVMWVESGHDRKVKRSLVLVNTVFPAGKAEN